MATPADRGITSKPGRWLKERIGGQNLGVGGGVGGAAAANGNVIVNNHHNHYGNGGGGSSSRVTRPAYHHSARTAPSGASSSLYCNLESMKQTILQKLVSTPAENEEDLLGFCEWAMTYVGRIFTSHRTGPIIPSSGPTFSALGGGGGAAGMKMEVDSSDGEGDLHHSNPKSSLVSENGHSQPLSHTKSGGSSGGAGEESDQSSDGTNDDKPNEMHHASASGEIILGENGRRGGGKTGNGVAVGPAVSSSTNGTASAKSTMTAANGNGKNGEEGDKKESSDLQEAATGGGRGRITGARTGNNGGGSKPVSKSELETVSILLEFSTQVKEKSQHQNGLSPRPSESSSSTTTAGGSTPISSAWPSSHHINNHNKHGQQKKVVPPFPGEANGSSAPASMNGFVPPPPQISPRTAWACTKQERGGGGGKGENGGTEAHHSPQLAPPAPISSYESQEMQFNVKPGALHKTTIGASCPPPSVLPFLHHNHQSESSTSSSASSPSAESSNGHGVVVKRESPKSAGTANQSPGRIPAPPSLAGGGHQHLNHHYLPHMHNIHPPQANQQQPGGMMDVVIATQHVYYMQAGCPHPEGIRAGRWTYFHGVGEKSCKNGHNNIFMGQLLGQEEIPSKVVAGIVRYNQDPRHNAVLLYYMPQDIFFLAPVQHIERLVGMEFLPEEALCRLRDKVLRDWIPCPSRETETPSAVLPPHMYLPTPRVVMEASTTPSANGVTSAAGMGHHYHPPRSQSFPPPPPPSMINGGVVGPRNGLVNGYENKHTKNRSTNGNGNGSPQVIMKAPPPPLHHHHHHLPHQQQQQNTTGEGKGKQLSPPLPPSSIPNTSSSISSSSASSSSISSMNGGGGSNSFHLHHINHHHHHHPNTSPSPAIIQPRHSLKRPPPSPLHTEDHHLQQQQPKEKKQKQHMELKGEERGRASVVLRANASGIKSAS